MNKADVIAFFDRCAPEWDADMIRNEPVIQKILDTPASAPVSMCWTLPVERAC